MQELPLHIAKNGFAYTQVSRGAKSFIYRQDAPENYTYFEVFRRKVANEREMFGVLIPEHEMFPGNEDFGEWAWTYMHLEDAERRMIEIELEPEKDKSYQSINQ